ARALWKTRKTWLSGMSPAAAAFASACNAPGLPAAVVVGAADGGVVACAVTGVVAAVWLVPPHPASATTRATDARTIRLMLAVSRQAPETRLNALLTRPRRSRGDEHPARTIA